MELSFIIGLILGISTFLLCLFCFYGQLSLKKKLHSLAGRRTKKKNRRMLARERRKLTLAMNQYKKWGISLCIFSVLILFFSGYLSYYQTMNLAKKETEVIAKAYYLLGEFDKQVSEAEKSQGNKEKSEENLRYLSAALANYSTIKAGDQLNEHGQLLLNRYYRSLNQLGINASLQLSKFYGNSSISKDFLSDSQRVKSYQKEVFRYYKINESAFQIKNQE